MTSFEPVIGLEVHAQLRTVTKIFCGCSTAFGAPPNTHVCPICLGLPGALPALNRRAVDYAIKAALALNCTVHRTSIFARKNYFYPDLPKGYQISQYEQPLATNGRLEYEVDGAMHRVGITRIHMEEDAGKSLHEGFPDSDRKTYVDYNRSGVPLIEIVSEPDLRSAEAAAEYFSRLRSILTTLGVNDGNMEEGSLRCDANVSVRPVGAEAFGVKAEVKNLNSFRFVQKAIAYEVERQVETIRNGGTIVQETRLWDASNGRTYPMRSKEDAHDYRYFPEPDLPPLIVDDAWLAEARSAAPELPDARKRRYMTTYALSEYDAVQVSQSHATGEYFEAVARATGAPKAAVNWIMGELARKMNETGATIEQPPIPAASLAELIQLVETGKISGSIAKDVFEKMSASARSARDIVDAEGLAQIEDSTAIDEAVRAALAANPSAIEQFRSGKKNAFGFLVGQAMKALGGKANPRRVNDALRQALEG